MKKRGSKAQGLTFNVIIIAALGLFILIVLIMIFTGRIEIFQKSTSCSARDGICLAEQYNYECPAEKPITVMTEDCRLVKQGSPQNERPGQCCISFG